MESGAVYLLWGPESYLINRKIEEIVAQMAAEMGGEPEIMAIDGDETLPTELGPLLEFSPLFAMARVVIIRNPGWLGKAARSAKKAEGYLQVMEDYLRRDNQGQVVILTAAENNTANPVVKMLQKQARIINIKSLAAADLEKWCRRELEQRQVKVGAAAVARMAASGQDMYYLENMFEKMSLLKRDEAWQVADVEEHLDSREEIKVFKLTDALLNRNLKSSLAVFRQLLDQGQPHLLILAMIAQQFVVLGKVKFGIEAGYSSAQLAQLTGQKDFVIRKMREKGANFDSREIRRVFERLLETDTILKSESKDPRIVMETLLVDICSR